MDVRQARARLRGRRRPRPPRPPAARAVICEGIVYSASDDTISAGRVSPPLVSGIVSAAGIVSGSRQEPARVAESRR